MLLMKLMMIPLIVVVPLKIVQHYLTLPLPKMTGDDGDGDSIADVARVDDLDEGDRLVAAAACNVVNVIIFVCGRSRGQ